MVKLIPLTRAIVIILSMLFSQLPLLNAAASVPIEGTTPVLAVAPDVGDSPVRLAASSAPGEVASSPLRQDPGQGCKIKVLAAAVEDYVTPNPALPPDGMNNLTPFGATGVTDAEGRSELLIWVVIMNWTDDPECQTNEKITINSVTVQVGDVAPILFPTLPAELAAPRQPGYYIEGQFTYGISTFTPSPINISVFVNGTDADGNPVQDEDDSWSVTLSTPGFEVTSFTPEMDTASPGDLVDFTLRVRNTRAGVEITDLAFLSDVPAYQGQCNDIGDWDDLATGEPFAGPIPQNAVAECVIRNVVMPPDTETGEFTLTGTVTAQAGEADPAIEEVESEPVQLHQASINVTKTVERILRGTQEVQPPAQPGDRVQYAITVENTSHGGIAIDTITIQDSLTGRVGDTQGQLPAGESRTWTTEWTVRPNSQDPLTNIASVTARAVNTGKSVAGDAAASVDVADSALRLELVALDEVADVGDTVEFQMTLYNDGDQPISGLAYPTLGGTLESFGTLPALGGSLAAHSSRLLTWPYTILAGDPDPLINTVRVSGTVEGRTLFVQEQAVVDVTNPAIGIAVTVTEPVTPTVLRGGEAIYAIEVTNKGASPICGVQVGQLKVDPDTGQETPIFPAIPMNWLSGTPGQLDGTGTGGEAATASTTYLVTSTDKDPLHMVFTVTALSSCEPGATLLTDRTSRVLNISDVQVNAAITAEIGGSPVTSAEMGQSVQFNYLVTNVGTIPLSNVTATFCFINRSPAEPPNCTVPLVLNNLQGGALLQFETAAGLFTSPALLQEDADLGTFPVEVTLYATDNRGRDVTLKTSTEIDVTSPDFALEVTGPTEAVNGDTHTFSFTVTNDTNTPLTDVHVYRLLDPTDSTSGVEVGTTATLSGVVGENTFSGDFEYTLDAPPGAASLQLMLRANGTKTDANLVATATHDIMLLPLITVEKTGPDVAVPGENITYHVVITNNSTSQTFTTNAGGLSDDVLADYGVPVTFADFTWPGATPGVIPAGGSATADFVLPNVQADVSPLVNTFSVAGTNDAGQAASAVGQHEMEVTCPVIFLFNVTEEPAPDSTNPFDFFSFVLNETLRWEITLVNTTQGTLNSVSITESLNWGGPVPDGAITWPTGTPGVLPPNESATLQAFTKVITNDYYTEIIEDVFMTSSLVASFSPVASRSECVGQYAAPLYSPIAVVKEVTAINGDTANTSLALTGDTITYTLSMVNLMSANDAHNTFTVTLSDPLLSPDPIPMYYNGPGQPATQSGVVSPGEIVTGPSLTYVVKDSDPEKLINTATAEFPDPADPETNFYTEGTAEVLTIAPLTLVKTPSATTGMRGTTITYAYELTNNTEYPIDGIRLVDDPIGGLIPGPYTPVHGATLSLDGFESFTIPAVPYDIPLDAANPVVNTATATGTIYLPDGPRDLTAEATIAVNLDEPEITIEKRIVDAETGETLPDVLPQHIVGGDGIFEGTVGQEVRYCFTVTNESPVPESYVADILVEDVNLGAGALQPWFRAAVEQLDPSRPGLNQLYGGEAVDFCYPPEGAQGITLNRAQGDPQTNTVTLTGVTPAGGGTIPVYTDDSVTVDLIGTDILITKSASQPLAYIGQDVTYTIRIENRNDSLPIDNIQIFDSFLGEIEPTAVDWTANGSGGNPGSLGVGGEATFSYTYTLQPRDPDPLINTATVTGTLGDDEETPVEDSTQSSLAVTPSQLLVRKFPSVARSLPEKSVRYTIAITNVGQIPVYDLRATDTRYTGDLTPTMTELMPNKTAYITYDLTMPTVAELAADPTLDPFINTVTVEGTVYDAHGIAQPDPVTGQATAAVDIIQPNISITKAAQIEAATPGSDVTYTITIRNTGSEGDTLTDLIFTDVTSGDTVDLESVCPGAGCGFVYGPEPYVDDDSDPGTPMVPNPVEGDAYDPERGLRSREFLTGTITVIAPPATAGSEFTNVAAVEASLGETTVGDRSSATIDIRQEGIRVTKTADASTATIGQNVLYTVTVENTGTVPFTRITIADAGMPGGTATITSGFPDTAGDAATLDPGEVYEHQYTHQITPADSDPYTNRASVSAYTAVGSMVLNAAQVTVDVQLAELNVEKFVCTEDNAADDSVPETCTSVVNVADALPDDVFYYLRITNPSIVPIQNISVTDTLVLASVFDAIVWPQAPNGLAANDGAEGGPDEVWFKYAYTVTETDLDVLWNTVTVSGETPTDPPQTAQDVARAALRLVTGDLQLSKSGPAQAQVEESVTYTLTVTHLNPDGEAITDITIVDPLSPSGTAALCTLPNLAPGASDSTCSFSRTVALADPSPLINQAFAQGTQASAPGGVVSDTATHTLEVVTPGLSVSKTASVPIARFGDTVTFTYVIENTGQGGIAALTVTDSDPLITFSAPWPTSLPAGQTVVRTATRTLTAHDPDPYTNTVTVAGLRGGLPVRAQATATVALSDAALVVSNAPDRQYALDGQAVIFAYTARNLGSDPLDNLTFSDNGLCIDLDTQLASTTLAPRSSVTVYCMVNAVLPGPLVSTVRVAADVGGVPLSDTATAQVQVTTGGLLVSKTADRLVAAPGDTITYTITLTNVGDEPLSTLSLFESMSLTLTPALPATLQPGASVTLTGASTVPTDNPPDSVANSVSVTAVGANTQTPFQDSASAAVAILEDPNAVLALTKQANSQTGGAAATLRARPGDTVTYTFTVRNVSGDTASDITLSDPALGGDVSLGDLGPGETITHIASTTIPVDHALPTFDNTASVSTDSSTTPVLQDTASASVPVQLLGLTKTATEEEVEPGGTVTYTFTVESFTQAALSGVTLEDEGLTLDTPLPDPITTAGATVTGSMTVPVDYENPDFVNTAAVMMGGVQLDEASATVPVVARTLEVTLDAITQMHEGTALTLIQTGEEAEIAFTLDNVGSSPIAELSVNATIAIPDSPEPVTVTCTRADGSPLPFSLAAGAAAVQGVCKYTPPAGLPSYHDAGGLEPLVTLTARGNAGGTIVTVEDEAAMPLVDLLLTALLTVDPIEAERGDEVDFTLTLTNEGASPIGCAPAGVDPLPCQIRVAFDDEELTDLFDAAIDGVATTVLNPGDPPITLIPSIKYEIPADALTKPFGVTVTGGYHDAALETAGLLDAYTVEATSSVILAVQYKGLLVALTDVLQTTENVLVDGTAPLPLQTGKPVTLTFTVTNDDAASLTDLEYSVFFANAEWACVPTQADAFTSLPIGVTRTLSCQFTPEVALPAYFVTNGLIQQIAIVVEATNGAGERVSSSSLPAGEDESGEGEQDPAPTISEVHLVDLKLGVEVFVLKGETGSEVPVTAQAPALPGDTVKIRLRLINQGASRLGCPAGVTETACALRLVSLNVPLPAGTLDTANTQLRNISLAPGQPGQSVQINLQWIVPTDATQTQIIAVAEAGTYSTVLDNIVAYLAHGEGLAPFVLGTPKLTVAIQAAPNPPVFGQNITYMVTVTNAGLIPVTLQPGTYQIIPLSTTQAVDGIMLMSYGERPRAQTTSGTLNFSPTVLQPGQVATAMVAKSEDQTGPYRFVATVTGVGVAQPVTVSAELTLTPTGTGDALDPNATEPQVTKEPSAANVQPGGAVVWTITVRNGSTAVMNGVVVTDTVPPTMTVSTAASSKGQAAVNGAQVTVQVGTLNPGETATVTINTTLAALVTAPATVTNTGCAARQGGAQVCKVGTVTVGPGVGSLPATGIRSSGGALGWRADGLLGIAFSGALMLFLSVQVSRRRKLAAVIFVLVALVAIGGGVALVLTGGDDSAPDETDEAQVPLAASEDAETSAPSGDADEDDASEDVAADPEAIVAMPTPYVLPTPSGARTLLIPKLGETFQAPIPILEVPIINRQWDVSGLGYYIGWLDGTTWVEPDWGNTVLAAHVQLDANTPGPFWGLNELVPGDEIIIREGDVERVFVVMSTRTVAPDDWTVTAPTEGPMLTLVTCTDWNNAYGIFANRLVVQAIPVA